MPTVRIPADAAEQSEGLPIASIEIVGNRRVGREDVLSYLREKPGHLFKVENLTGDVHALWDSGFFEDIQVDLTTNDRGVVLRFIVREQPEHQGGPYEGNDELDNDKLNEAVEREGVGAVAERPRLDARGCAPALVRKRGTSGREGEAETWWLRDGRASGAPGPGPPATRGQAQSCVPRLDGFLHEVSERRADRRWRCRRWRATGPCNRAGRCRR